MTNFADTVNQINEIIRKELWFDFVVDKYEGSNLTILGGIDIHLPESHSIEIKFEQVFYYSGFFEEWHSDTSNPVLIIPENLNELNNEYEIEQGYNLFMFITEDYKRNVMIAAKDISYQTKCVQYYNG